MTMKIKTTILPLLAFAASSCLGLTDDGRRLKEVLQLVDLHGPTNRYEWVCPSNVTVSNLTFNADRIRQREFTFNFDLLGSDGTRLGDCSGGIAISAESAIDAVCDRIMYACSAPVEAVHSVWHVDRDTKGNVILKSPYRDDNGSLVWNRSEIYRTYGNLYFNVVVDTNRTTLAAWDFAMPLILGGLRTR